MAAKISIIMPVYQAENVVGRIIKNLKRQTMREFEVFLVDNASSDGTMGIMKRETVGDERFRILEERKCGPSAARNRGLSYAQGEWLIFLDADDMFEDDFLEKLLKGVGISSDNVVMAVCGYETYENGQCVYASPAEQEYYTIEEMIKRLFQVEHYQGFIWNKLMKRDIIKRNGLHFDEEIFYNEDRLFVLEYLLCCRKLLMEAGEKTIHMLDTPLYQYQLREESAMGVSRKESKVSNREVTEMLAFEKMLAYLKREMPENKRLFDLVTQDMVHSELRLFRRMLNKKPSFCYRKHLMRKFAIKANEMEVDFADDKEKILWRVFIRYGKTGVAYTTNPDFFADIR